MYLCTALREKHFLKEEFGEVTVETENSPLKKALNCTATLQLEHNENTFSFTATAIRYTEKQDVAYSWKLDHTDWSTPSVDNRIRFSNLPPGEYIFSVRALSIDNGRPFAQRNMHIIIRLKTSVLLAASLKIGALLGGASSEDAEQLYDFGFVDVYVGFHAV